MTASREMPAVGVSVCAAARAGRSAATSCFSTSRIAEKSARTPRSESGPAFAATSVWSSSASRSGSIQRSPASSLWRRTAATSSRRRFKRLEELPVEGLDLGAEVA